MGDLSFKPKEKKVRKCLILIGVCALLSGCFALAFRNKETGNMSIWGLFSKASWDNGWSIESGKLPDSYGKKE